jgi:hypothetical protein
MTFPIRLLVKELGFRSLTDYAIYQVALRSGYIKARTSDYDWNDRPAAYWRGKSSAALKPVFFFSDRGPLPEVQQSAQKPVIEEADGILRGSFRLYGGEPVSLGFPPDWLQAEDGRLVSDRHWSAYSTVGEVDLRTLWELSRYRWAYKLAQAFVLSGRERYAVGFFDLLQSWQAANPPNVGPNWISGQEIALRVIALTFAFHAFEPWLGENPQQSDELAAMIAVHADRLPLTLRYARAQRNNHLVTEAVGLFTTGLMFPSLKEAEKWKALGRKWLVRALADQIFEDGGYIQHSTNYLRIALAAATWAAQLGALNGEPLPNDTMRDLAAMTNALAALIDESSGQVPNFGHNDGSDILPLASTPRNDYRPTLQAAALVFLDRPALVAGPWDETAGWLGLLETRGTAESGASHLKPQSDLREVEFPQAGLYMLRGQNTWAMMRCARFRSRPSHSDQLNVDLWWDGHNIAKDRGTYRYTDDELSSATMHNALVADRREPMRRAGRFLWLSRKDADYLGRWRSRDGVIEVLAGEHPLPGKLEHRRSLVRVGEPLWVVIDELQGVGTHEARLIWTLPDWPWTLEGAELSLEGEPGRLRLSIEPSGVELALYRERQLVAGSDLEEDPDGLGWWCPSYATVEPALSLVARLRGELPLRLSSWWRLGELDPAHLGLAWDSLEDGPLSLFFSEQGGG